MKIYFDGGCQPNPGKMEAAIVSECGSLKMHIDTLGWGTNNEAEWSGLIMALNFALQHDGPVTILGDSKLVISQADGIWKCNSDVLKTYLDEYRSMLATAKNKITLQHVRRHLNLAGIYIEEIQKKR